MPRAFEEERDPLMVSDAGVARRDVLPSRQDALDAIKPLNPYGDDPSQPTISGVRMPHDLAALGIHGAYTARDLLAGIPGFAQQVAERPVGFLFGDPMRAAGRAGQDMMRADGEASPQDIGEAALSPLVFGVASPLVNAAKGVQVLSKAGNTAGAFGSAAARELDQGFYSPSLEAAKILKQDKGKVGQMRAMLLKAGGKEKELAATGFDQAFPDPNAPVTRQDVEDFLRENRVRVSQRDLTEEVDYDALADAEDRARQEIMDEDYKKFVDEETGETVIEFFGDEIYRGAAGSSLYDRAIEQSDELTSQAAYELVRDNPDRYGDFEVKHRDYFPSFDRDTYSERLITLDKSPNGAFEGSHWATPNVLAHMRTGDFFEVTPEAQQRMEDIRSQIRDRGDHPANAQELLAMTLSSDPMFQDMVRQNYLRQGVERTGDPNYQLTDAEHGAAANPLQAAREYAAVAFRPAVNEYEGLLQELEKAKLEGNRDARYLGEVQSDWAQQGRKRGFRVGDPAELERMQQALESAEQARQDHISTGFMLRDGKAVYRTDPSRPQDYANLENADRRISQRRDELRRQESALENAQMSMKTMKKALETGFSPSGRELTDDTKAWIKRQLADTEEKIALHRGSVFEAQSKLNDAEAEFNDLTSSMEVMPADEAAAWMDQRRRLNLQAREADNELNTARAGIPNAPFVQNTDDWVDLALKRALLDAAGEGVDRIYLPTGEAVRSYTYGGAEGQGAFYGGPGQAGIVPKNMQNILRKAFGKKDAPQMRLSEEGSMINGYFDDPDYQFPYFDLTPEQRAKLKEEGLPLFLRMPPTIGAFGIPRGAFEETEEIY